MTSYAGDWETSAEEEHRQWIAAQLRELTKNLREGGGEQAGKATPPRKPNPYGISREHFARMDEFYAEQARNAPPPNREWWDRGMPGSPFREANEGAASHLDAKTMDQIRRLEALRDGTTFEGERQSAQAAIDRILAKHGVELPA